MLGYQRLDVDQCAVRLLAHCTRLSNDAPKGYAPLADQLRRASLSVPLNGIARGSAMECGAILDALAAVGGGDTTVLQEALGPVVRIVEMLSKMCR